MTERVRGIAVVGMIVKTGLQDATKNVRIYGTISAASNPSARPFHRRRASRIALPCPFSSPLSCLLLTPAQIFFSTAVPLPPSFRETHVGSYFLSSVRRCAPPYPLSTPPCPLSSSPPDRSTPVGRGAPPHGGRAQRGDRPHRRGHHFNVTLIKSNNQYLPRKKF